MNDNTGKGREEQGGSGGGRDGEETRGKWQYQEPHILTVTSVPSFLVLVWASVSHPEGLRYPGISALAVPMGEAKRQMPKRKRKALNALGGSGPSTEPGVSCWVAARARVSCTCQQPSPGCQQEPARHPRASCAWVPCH